MIKIEVEIKDAPGLPEIVRNYVISQEPNIIIGGGSRITNRQISNQYSVNGGVSKIYNYSHSEVVIIE